MQRALRERSNSRRRRVALQSPIVSVGDVLGEAFDLYRRHFGHLIPLAFVFFLVVGLITLLLTLAFGAVAGSLIGAILSVVGFYWLAGALVQAVADIRDGRVDMTIGETFSSATPFILPLLGAGILAGIGIAIGLILLIVPGLILLTWWCLIGPVIVLEKLGVMDSFGRSRELVRGHGWAVFGVVFLTWLLTGVFRGIIIAILSPLASWLGSFLSDVIAGSLTAPFAALALTLMYFRLARHEVGVEAPAPGPATI
jgi:hypothetical protein